MGNQRTGGLGRIASEFIGGVGTDAVAQKMRIGLIIQSLMIAQQSGGGKHIHRTVTGFYQFAGSFPPAAGGGKCRVKPIRVTAGEMKCPALFQPAFFPGCFDQPRMTFIELLSNGQCIADGIKIPDLMGRPQVPGCFQNPSLPGVRDDKTVVVGHAFIFIAADASLPEVSQKLYNNFNSPGCVGCALQSQTQQVHPGQAALFFQRHAGEDRFVADHNTFFIGPHLRAPHPERTADQDAESLFHLGYCQVSAPHICLSIMHPRRMIFQGLSLIRLPVAVFAEDYGTIGRCR